MTGKQSSVFVWMCNEDEILSAAKDDMVKQGEILSAAKDDMPYV
jgi:hypothetical protein